MIKKAYSLLEAIVAISVVTVIITASVTVINSSLQSLDENGSNLMAYNFVQEGLGYFERMVKTNKLRFPGRADCKFVPLSLPNCNPLEDGGALEENGSYDLSFDARDEVMDYTIIESEGSLNNNGEAGNQFDNNKLNSYKKCTDDLQVAGGDLDGESCVYFYSSDEDVVIDGVSSVGTTKFVRVIEKEGNNVTSSVYFFVVGKTELQKIELSTNL